MSYESKQEHVAELEGLFVERAAWSCLLDRASGLKTEELLKQIDREMLTLFSDIVNVLNDQTLDDPACFQRVEALVRAFEKVHCPVRRHDW